MKVNVLQENLLKALSHVSRIISSKPQLPILQSIHLSIVDNRFRIAATNLETTEVVWVAAKIIEDGGICVPARLLTELVMTLPQEAVTLEVKEGGLLVTGGKTIAKIPGAPANEYPQLPTLTTTGEAKIEKKLLATAIDTVLFAAATDEGRPLLTGVRVKTTNDTTTFAATDGYRLSVRTVALSPSEPFDMVVPAKAMAEVVKLLSEDKTTETLSVVGAGVGQLGFVIGETEIITRLIDGEYPNYQKIIPSSKNTTMTVEKDLLLRAVKSAAIFARDNANIIRFTVSPTGLMISANTPSVGENQVEVEASVDGEGGEIAFNSRFLIEFLSHVGDSDIQFEMTGSLNPGVFKLVGDETFVHIIMPVRVQS